MTESTEASQKSLNGVSFEDALRELEQIVGKLEAGQVDLSESISFYERGEALRAHCEKQLKDAELRIEKISLSSEGKAVGLEPAQIDS